MEYLSATALSDILEKIEEFPTSIEVIKLRGSNIGCGATLECETFNDDVLDHIVVPKANSPDNSESVSPPVPLLQILFLKSVRDQDGCTTNRLQVKKDTLEKLCIHLGINTAFMEAIAIPSIWSKQSCGSFHRYDNNGKEHALDGFYHYFEDWGLGPLHLWFSYDIVTHSTIYVLVDCPEKGKSRIEKKVNSSERDFLFRPLAIDYIIAEECASWREIFINKRWEEVFDWRDTSGNKMDPPILTQVLDKQNLYNLHSLLRTWNMLHHDLSDLTTRLDFLILTASSLRTLGTLQAPSCASASEALQYLRARNDVRRRWLTSFDRRTELISDYVFGIEAQRVNQAGLENAQENRRNGRVNVRILQATAMIADETAKDSSAMITIATMTMLFLPGTLISAIFSMAFFTFGSSSSSGGNSTIDVSPWIWLYFAITIPLTGLVLGFYLYWRRKRAFHRKSSSVLNWGEL